MKNRIGLVILVIICLGLGIGLVITSKQATEQHRQDAETIVTVSNNLAKIETSYTAASYTVVALAADAEKQREAYTTLSNQHTKATATLAQTASDLNQASNSLVKTEAALKASQEEVARNTAKIAELQAQNQELDNQASRLSTQISGLKDQITATEKKLAVAEGDKSFLEKELKRLMTEKAELERQFNDITALKAQVAKLREQAHIAQRVEWARQGVTSPDQKGAQKLIEGLNTSSQTQPKQPKQPKSAYDLNVEVHADGSVKVIPPLTNAPPSKPTPK